MWRTLRGRSELEAMKGHEDRYCWISYVSLLIMIVATQGCASLQIPSQSGMPRLIGLGWARTVKVRTGQVYKVVAPGLSVRLYGWTPGLSLGWQETLLFCPSSAGESNSVNRPIAVQNKTAGIDFTSNQITVGYQRSFCVPLPGAGKNVVQFISYSEREPQNTIVERKENQ